MATTVGDMCGIGIVPKHRGGKGIMTHRVGNADKALGLAVRAVFADSRRNRETGWKKNTRCPSAHVSPTPQIPHGERGEEEHVLRVVGRHSVSRVHASCATAHKTVAHDGNTRLVVKNDDFVNVKAKKMNTTWWKTSKDNAVGQPY